MNPQIQRYPLSHTQGNMTKSPSCCEPSITSPSVVEQTNRLANEIESYRISLETLDSKLSSLLRDEPAGPKAEDFAPPPRCAYANNISVLATQLMENNLKLMRIISLLEI